MNEETVQLPGHNELDLGISTSISLRRCMGFNATEFEKVIAALEVTTTLTDLSVSVLLYQPTPENNRRIVEPLCRCLSNLRSRNEHHKLRDLTLRFADSGYHAGTLDVFEQFLIAAKTCGIQHLKLHDGHGLPMQFLVEFCHDNNNLKELTLEHVFFSDGGVAMSVPSSRPQDSSVIVSLDKLELDDVVFENSTDASTFANFMARVTVPTLVLGNIRVYAGADGDHILSEIKIPSVKQLRLCDLCRIEHFKAALEGGTSSLIELDVRIKRKSSQKLERFKLLANFIRRAVRLNSFAIHASHRWQEATTRSRQLELAIEACATITRIQVTNVGRSDIWYRIATRNEELARFVASPGTYPTDKLLGLMGQLDNCPTGRYMLACSLPEVFSFEKIKSTDSPTTEPKPKKRKFS